MAQTTDDGMPLSPSTMTLETYQFPSNRLRRQLKEPGKTPLVLVACGSCTSSSGPAGLTKPPLPYTSARRVGKLTWGAQSRRLRFCI